MRYIIGLSFCLILASCWSHSEDLVSTPTSCPYEAPAEVPEYKLSTYPDVMSIGIDQQKLVRFMAVKPSEATCYLLSNDQISLVKIAGGDRDPNPRFASLKMATGEAEQNWLRATENLKNTLMGLTTLRFSTGGGQEQITATTITVREDANLWHLWHEYSHALIGQARAANPNQSLYIPAEDFLRKKLEELRAMDTSSEAYSAALQKLIQNYRDHIDKSYIDEMLIEATLIDLTNQHKAELEMTNEDYLRTMGAIDFFKQRYNKFYKKTRRDLSELLQENENSETNKMTLVRSLVYFADQHRRIVDITDQATSDIELMSPSGIE